MKLRKRRWKNHFIINSKNINQIVGILANNLFSVLYPIKYPRQLFEKKINIVLIPENKDWQDINENNSMKLNWYWHFSPSHNFMTHRAVINFRFLDDNILLWVYLHFSLFIYRTFIFSIFGARHSWWIAINYCYIWNLIIYRINCFIFDIFNFIYVPNRYSLKLHI